MPKNDRSALIDGEKRLGNVTKVSAGRIELNLPHALAAAGRRGVARGTVGDFVFIDCDAAVILGRIVEVHIPERNRPALERQIEREPSVEPVGSAQLLATIRKTTQSVVRGVLVSPRVGDLVFEANGPALSRSIQAALFGGIDVEDGEAPIAVSLGRISGIDAADIATRKAVWPTLWYIRGDRRRQKLDIGEARCRGQSPRRKGNCLRSNWRVLR